MLKKLLNPANRILNLFIVASAFTYVSCQKDDIPKNNEETDSRIESSVVKDISVINELVIPHNVKTQQFRIKSDYQWQIKLPDDIDWVSVTPLFGNEGESILTISISRNNGQEERRATFRLAKNTSSHYSSEEYSIVQCAVDSDENGFFDIGVTSAGSLEMKLNGSGIPIDTDKITRLRISGPLNDEDCVYIQNNLKNLIALDIEKAIISKLPQYFFCYTPVLDVSLPERLSSIEKLFYKYPEHGGSIIGAGVKAVRISKNSPITDIPQEEFEFCTNLRYITLPDGLKTIGDSAFQYSFNLRQISLPEGVTSIGAYTFWCAGIQEIHLPKSIQTIGSNGFTNSSLEKVTISTGSQLATIGSNAYSDCYNLREFTFPPGLTSIGTYAFEYTKLKNVTLPNTVQYIGNGAFAETPLESINIPANCQLGYSFGNCPNLKEVTIEGNLSSNSSPYLNESLQRVVFTKAVTTIHYTLLSRCSDISELVLLNPVPPSITYSDLYAPLEIFPNVSRNKCIIRVPKGAGAAYKADRVWGTFENIVEQ